MVACAVLTVPGLLAVAGPGCSQGDGVDRQALSGTVRLDGRPLTSGSILFEPISERAGTAVGAKIRHGEFVIARDDGPVPGLYRVRIYASSGVQAPAPKGASERKPRPMVELIPSKYNSHSELTAQVVSGRNRPSAYDLEPEP